MPINNPIFRREFISTARSWKTNFLLWAYLIILATLLLVLWPGSGIHSIVTDTSKQIFSLFFSTNLTLLILLVPAFAATSITYERENSTFASLFTTLMTPFDIMAGKLSAAILMLVILVFMSMPIAAVCALTGGVSLMFLGKVMIIVLLTAISYGLVGLACSSMCERSSSAILMNYVFILCFAGGTWLPDALLGNLIGFRQVWQIIRSISPYDALFYLLYPENYRMTTNIQLANCPITPFIVFIISSTIITITAFIIFYRKIIRPNVREATIQGEFYTGLKKGIKRKLTWPFYLIDPLKRKKNIGRFSNPVFVAEMRSKLFANPKFVLRTVSFIFIISLSLLTLIALQYGYSLKADTIRMVAIIFQIGVVAMLAPGVSSGLITDEMTSGTFMLLRLTLLKPATVIFGKLKATFFYALIFIISSLFVLLAMAYLEHQQVFPEVSIISSAFWVGSDGVKDKKAARPNIRMGARGQFASQAPTRPVTGVFERAKEMEWWKKLWETYRRIFVWIIILLLSTVAFLTGGLFASCFCRTTGIATAVSYTITALICLVSFAPLVLGERLSASLSFFILSFNPIAGAMQITSDAFEEFPNLWQYNLLTLTALIAFFLIVSIARTWQLFNKRI